MKFFYLFLPFVFASFFAQAQVDTTLTSNEKAALDSMLNDLLGADSLPNKSYFDVSVTAGNSFFSTTNNSFNAVQSQTQQLFYTPTFGYFHKSGLGISFSSYFTNDSGNFKAYQHTITPFWEFSGKKLKGSISYTRNINGSKTSFDVSPFKNDFFVNVELAKPWFQPGVSLGFSTGKTKEYFDTTITSPIFRRIRDTITTKLKAFSMSFSISHSFEFNYFFTQNDLVSFKPSLLLNLSSYKWYISHSSSLNQRRPFVQRVLKNKFGDGEGAEKLAIQSIGLNIDATYFIGKFYFEPNLYLDYYLPKTTDKRITSIFSLTAGLSF